MTKIKPPPQRAFVPPSQLVWNDERLSALDKDQLANLLANLQTQLELGRISEETATDLEQRIRARLPKSAARKQRGTAPARQDEQDDADRKEAAADE
jgi:hypothetical protein